MTVIYKGLDCLADASNPLYKEYKKVSQSGVNAWLYQRNYGYYVAYFGAVLILLMILKRLIYMFSDYSYRNSRLGYKDHNIVIFNKIIAISRFISYRKLPLIISRITGLPSSIGTLIVLSSSSLFVFCYCFIPHPWYRGCQGFGSPQLAVRAGLMALGMIPFIFILSGKTNFISQVTGISYEKLNIFHQALGWGSLFLSLVHTIPFFVQPLKEGGTTRLSEKYHSNELYKNGVPTLIVLVMLCLLSTRFSRKLCYELYLHLHWLLGCSFFGLLTWHIYDEMDSQEWMWGTLGFWMFQMIYRALVKTTFKPNDYCFKSKNAQLSRISNGNFQVIIPIEGENELNWKPGQHIFVRFIYGISTIDNHPFSILSIPRHHDKSEIKLLVKPHNGLTNKLYHLLQDENRVKDLNLYVDGPYGGMNRDVLAFDKVILISSGSGVTVTWPFVEYITENLENPSNVVSKIDFKWIIKDFQSIDWIKNELVMTLNKIIEFDSNLIKNFTFEIFVTNSDKIEPTMIHDEISLKESSVISMTIEKPSGLITTENVSDYLTIHQGSKPFMESYLQSSKLEGRNCFIVSGTKSLQNDCGCAVSQLQRYVLENPKIKEVYLHTENFGW